MAETETEDQVDAVDAGSYEVLRARLVEQARELGGRADSLNKRRMEAFGGAQMEVLGTTRVRTDNNCVPRDIVQVGGKLLFGYNVFIGLKTETALDDVLSLHELTETDHGFDAPPVTNGAGAFLLEESLRTHFAELYRYYKGVRLSRLTRVPGRLLAVFQIGERHEDIKILRWQVDAEGRATYLDNQGDQDHVFPPSHDFEWTPTGREHFVAGDHPHVSIDDEVFVETIGGDLTIKVENNTASGEGIYHEPVDDHNQGLDDGDIRYAKVGGLVLLRIVPYGEQQVRYFVFDTRRKTVQRVDAIGHACVQLPENQGIVFPGGYYLEDGEAKVFEGDAEGLEFERVVRSPNGEDVLYVFHRQSDGHYVLLPYNLIRKEVSQVLHGHGYSLFDDGRLVVFKAQSDEPTRVHPMQVWKTPFTSDELAAPPSASAGQLGRIGNAELVRGVSDAYTIKRLAENTEPSREVYEQLIGNIGRALDAYYWLDHEEVGDLKSALLDLRSTGELVVDEFEKVVEIRQRAQQELQQAREEQQQLLGGLRSGDFGRVETYMEVLSSLRRQRGHLITLRDLRYMDLDALAELETEAEAAYDDIGSRCADFLTKDAALAPVSERLQRVMANTEKVTLGRDLAPVGQELEKCSEGLDVLNEVVGGLKIEDAALRTEILEAISEVYGTLNRARAGYANKRKQVLGAEAQAEFGAQFRLFQQSVTNGLSQADSPAACDEQLSKLLLQLEELEGRFGEFDQLTVQLTAKREDVYEALEARKQQLTEERQRRAATLVSAAERILQGIGRRSRTAEDVDALNAYFAADPMVLKVHDLVEKLNELDESVRADALQSQLKSAKADALRALRDKSDLYEEGDSLIRLGTHRFSVNTQKLELTMVPREDGMSFHLTGTDYFAPVTDEAFLSTRHFWDQALLSETTDVYRSEYLAASMLFNAEAGVGGASLQAFHNAEREPGGLLEPVRAAAAERYDEGYERGVHDHDAALILGKLLSLYDTAGLLRFDPEARSLAVVAFDHWAGGEWRAQLVRTAASLGRLRGLFGATAGERSLMDSTARALGDFAQAEELDVPPQRLKVAARYLVEELMQGDEQFAVSAAALELVDGLLSRLDAEGHRASLEKEAADTHAPVVARMKLAEAWVQGYLGGERAGVKLDTARLQELAPAASEAVAMLVTGARIRRQSSAALPAIEVTGLLGQHARVQDGKLTLRLDAFLQRLREFADVRVPAFKAYREQRQELLETERTGLRLSELQPRVMSSFVRNKLIDEVYLPLIGKNFAKQIGAAGDGKRTDLMGLLLLISPPGYGKTTLMEYVAARLGLVFVKVNGPALGHDVTSFDPQQAGSATARQEVEKINMAFEMGSNVMLYLDDIQHTHPELLQKFISLCDGQRRVEGVWRGHSRTYDLRGRRFCVVMAGNPYTESGAQFQIPDMLANRADTYNLGDILDGKEDLFALSYLENSLTSNPVLAPIATRGHTDIYPLIRKARGEEVPGSELSHTYSAAEMTEITTVLQHMFRCQQLLLKVNLQYIESAAQQDAFRTEPPFKLQGSYRNMNKLAERVVAAMNEDELERLLDDHYAGESQTLTTGAEANLLKLAELRDRMTDEQLARWKDIKSTYERLQQQGGEDDPVARVTGSLAGLDKQLGGIREGLAAAVALADRPAKDPGAGDPVSAGLAALGQQLDALRLSVDAAALRASEPSASPVPQALLSSLQHLQGALEQVGRPQLEVTVRSPGSDGLAALLEQHNALLERSLATIAHAPAGVFSAEGAPGPTVAPPPPAAPTVPPPTPMPRTVRPVQPRRVVKVDDDDREQ